MQHRRDEFARLLDEHEQVVNELRRIESNSELRSLAENDPDDPMMFPSAADSSSPSPSSPAPDMPSEEPSQSTSYQEE